MNGGDEQRRRGRRGKDIIIVGWGRWLFRAATDGLVCAGGGKAYASCYGCNAGPVCMHAAPICV